MRHSARPRIGGFPHSHGSAAFQPPPPHRAHEPAPGVDALPRGGSWRQVARRHATGRTLEVFGQEARARRRARGVPRVMLREPHPGVRQSVEMRRRELLLPIAAEVAIAQIVAEDEDDVRAAARFGGGRPRGHCHHQKSQTGYFHARASTGRRNKTVPVRSFGRGHRAKDRSRPAPCRRENSVFRSRATQAGREPHGRIAFTGADHPRA